MKVFFIGMPTNKIVILTIYNINWYIIQENCQMVSNCEINYLFKSVRRNAARPIIKDKQIEIGAKQ